MSNTPPSGYILKGIPKNLKEAISKISHDKIKTITKSAIEFYIKSFLDTIGDNRDITKSIAPNSLQFISDQSFLQDADVTLRHTQVVRLFNQIRERLPAILIVDQGVTYIPTTIGDVDSISRFNNKRQMTYIVHCKIPLNLICVSGDVETTDTLTSLLILIFGPMKRLGGGVSLRGNAQKGDTWEVRLPLNFSIGGATGANVLDDPKDQVWSSEISIEVEYEDRIMLEDPNQATITEPIGVPDQNLNMPPKINFPDTIKINEKTLLRVSFYNPENHKIVIVDPSIATFDDNLRVTPRKLGKTQIQILQAYDNATVVAKDGMHRKVLVSKDFEVVF